MPPDQGFRAHGAADQGARIVEQPQYLGRAGNGSPIAIIDIGSNSIRLVVYEELSRSPAQLFNEKVLCGLGRSVVSTGRLPEDAVERALKALARFRILCDAIKVERVHVLATAAARDAANGPDFIAEAERILGYKIELLSGRREAQLSAYGILSGFHHADGVVGDLGGGSLELIDVIGNTVAQGITTKLGGLALQDVTGGSLKRAVRVIRDALADAAPLDALRGRNFYAVGGTWRALAALHMAQKAYPLHVMHGYSIPARDAVEFTKLVERADTDMLESIESVSEARRPLLGYGALLLDEIIRRGRPEAVVMSAQGVREGLLYELLNEEERRTDPLLAGAGELNRLMSRSPGHATDLIAWTARLSASLHLDETEDERRQREAVCLLSDLAWRTHPDYRGEQSLSLIAHAGLTGVDHPGRAFIALSVFFRHEGLSLDGASSRMRELVSPRMLNRARILGGMLRVAYLVSAAMPGVLPRTPLVGSGARLALSLPGDLEPVANERLVNRLRQLARIVGRDPAVVTVPNPGGGAA
ncbi:exopolyphosphatase/guanosine-5'-triphosphate,3'-diphosphate pyrophosphatase [Pseudochelatococcus lubricantis]|uniref:exopolyphosphatase n=1 Tax=Pseudochelatococcus lubricantis TaxID=1538102 RepID=A0ABX0UXJ2_9HYPH|nr:exopolyphosphatase/guanosine-5'-triphosphate,3'-diphosphate pyrophosphatase [Pseudochelatococcus lubricantis]